MLTLARHWDSTTNLTLFLVIGHRARVGLQEVDLSQQNMARIQRANLLCQIHHHFAMQTAQIRLGR